MFYEVIPTRLFRQNSGILTYSSDLKLQPGQLVRIPLGKTTTNGIVLEKVPAPDFPTKPISAVIDHTPLPEHLLKAISWLSKYYLTPLPTVANMILPIGVEKTRRSVMQPEKAQLSRRETPSGINALTPHEKVSLNAPQRTALRALKPAGTSLLHGVTGSGKTHIYLRLAEQQFQNNRSTILLVPEIALTAQLVQVFTKHFGHNVTVLHSRQTEAERHQAWLQILHSETPQIIIGPRSALFAPVHHLGLIIIDEAHEPAYFQENTPKYSAVRLASFIANSLKIPCILGTATPLATDYHLAKSNNALVELKQKAITTQPPKVSVIDLTSRANFTKNRYLSDQLIKSITNNLTNHHQTLIFHNRRGSAPLTICENCGWQALCPTCFLPLTLHTDNYQLICHTCGHSQAVPLSCPTCHHPSIIHKGFGTKLLETELTKLFPTAKIARFDGDNTKAESLENLYHEVKTGNFDIILGTQAIARGFDLPNLATVGVVQADAGLALPDYAAEERTFHLLTQVIGRVGRGHLDTAEAIIQTFQPAHPVITAGTATDYATFISYLLKKRRASHLPPFTHLAKLSVTYKTEATTLRHIKKLHATLRAQPGVSVSVPAPAFHERSRSGFTWQLTLKATSRRALTDALSALPPQSALHLTLDPPSLL